MRVPPNFHQGSTRFCEVLRGLRGGASTTKSTACCWGYRLSVFFWIRGFQGEFISREIQKGNQWGPLKRDTPTWTTKWLRVPPGLRWFGASGHTQQGGQHSELSNQWVIVFEGCRAPLGTCMQSDMRHVQPLASSPNCHWACVWQGPPVEPFSVVYLSNFPPKKKR